MAEKLYFRYWGKASSDNENRAGYHLLPYHCLDVAAVADFWRLHSSSLRRQKDKNAENGNYEYQDGDLY